MKTEGNILQKDIRRRKRNRMIVIYSVATLGAVAIFTLLGFVGKRQHDSVCWKLDVQVETVDNHKYIDESLITKLAKSATDSIIGKPVNKIDLVAIHNKLMENSSVREAHVYTTVDGRCMIKVQQRTPIARIFNANGESFYLDRDGFTMALSDYYSAKVPVFTGAIPDGLSSESFKEHLEDVEYLDRTMLDDIDRITGFISSNEFWSAQVEHIHVNSEGGFEIIPRVGNHRLKIGDSGNLEEKFKKLMAFYASTIHTRDLNQYSVIDVEYKDQVVCVKR